MPVEGRNPRDVPGRDGFFVSVSRYVGTPPTCGPHPALIDSGFVAHARDTAAWVSAHTDRLETVVNTHWHSDHVGGNALLQGSGAASIPDDAAAIGRRDPGCCAAEYLDQPVAPYTVDVALGDGDTVWLGEAQWEVVSSPGHTAGHIALWQPEERILVVGDALSDYDVGWVNLAVDGSEMAATALDSIRRLQQLEQYEYTKRALQAPALRDIAELSDVLDEKLPDGMTRDNARHANRRYWEQLKGRPATRRVQPKRVATIQHSIAVS